MVWKKKKEKKGGNRPENRCIESETVNEWRREMCIDL